MIECPSCNAQNPNGSISCTVCGGELPMSNPVAVLNKPKMAVFHVEEAILDNAAGERIAKRKGLSGKRFEREVASNVEKAVSRAGVRDYVNKLSRDGYTIAFITNMEPTYKSRLQARLRDLGYPVMADTMGPLVLSGGSQDNIRSLANRYDIIFSFGTSGAGTAKQLNVPGVYATVGDYIGNASNPYIAPQATPSPYSLSGLRPEPTPAPYTLANPANCGCGQDPCITYGPMPPVTNPPPKPRRQTSKKTGKKRRESAKKYFDRLMGNKMMNKEFPDNSQRSAVALSYVEKEYGKRGVNSVTKSWGAMANPSARGFRKSPEALEAAIAAAQLEKRAYVVAFIHTEAHLHQGNFAISPASEAKAYFTSLNPEYISAADDHYTVSPSGQVYETGNRVGGPITNPDHNQPNPIGNPPKKAKVEKAKKAYKKFHGGKTPDEIKTEKIDVGNVWYSLGECWTIGYMSPKENGNEHQKFIHEMNEESKDGNYPILYATMPEDGEPMLIIKGGSMKIGMRDGKAWLID